MSAGGYSYRASDIPAHLRVDCATNADRLAAKERFERDQWVRRQIDDAARLREERRQLLALLKPIVAMLEREP